MREDSLCDTPVRASACRVENFSLSRNLIIREPGAAFACRAAEIAEQVAAPAYDFQRLSPGTRETPPEETATGIDWAVNDHEVPAGSAGRQRLFSCHGHNAPPRPTGG